ncbi:hypothetical protein EVAR_60958_1 [Eumeta japonica]|uniref:Uncharacterized protein n=1 Tax=Eumeta variegata TaxID=151549 RepID=A0A4C1XSN2_EUMVA|nr:hypothetical protein EVAR_60958_1 [Eumeta japonica]
MRTTSLRANALTRKRTYAYTTRAHAHVHNCTRMHTLVKINSKNSRTRVPGHRGFKGPPRLERTPIGWRSILIKVRSFESWVRDRARRVWRARRGAADATAPLNGPRARRRLRYRLTVR